MKLTTTLWTLVQNRLPDSERALSDKIEAKTFGKLWRQNVAIALTRNEEQAVNAALDRVRAEKIAGGEHGA